MKQLDYKKMLEEIDKLVNNEFCMEMEGKLLPDAKKFTQGNAYAMAIIIGEVYRISHCVHCKACQSKYLNN